MQSLSTTLIRCDSIVTPKERQSKGPVQKASDYPLMNARGVMVQNQKGTAINTKAPQLSTQFSQAA